MVPALKLAATASVVGVVVAEISTGLAGGVGRLIIEYAREATSDPAKVFTAVFGAAALGLVMAGDRDAGRSRRRCATGRGRRASDATRAPKAVEVRGLSKVFNAGRPNAVDALVDIDLVIEPGEFVSLIGPSGCGKSTQLRLIANLLEPTTRRGPGQRQAGPDRRGWTRTTGWRSSRPACSTGEPSPRTSSSRSS